MRFSSGIAELAIHYQLYRSHGLRQYAFQINNSNLTSFLTISEINFKAGDFSSSVKSPLYGSEKRIGYNRM